MRDSAVEATTPIGSQSTTPAVNSRYRIQAIERAVSILNAFSIDDPELGVTELAQKVGLHKSTVHRFMVNLDAAGLVERNQRTGRCAFRPLTRLYVSEWGVRFWIRGAGGRWAGQLTPPAWSRMRSWKLARAIAGPPGPDIGSPQPAHERRSRNGGTS